MLSLCVLVRVCPRSDIKACKSNFRKVNCYWRSEWAVILLLAARCALAQGPVKPGADASPQLGYSRIFRGSTPEYLKITVNRAGDGHYVGGKLGALPPPRAFRLTPSTTNEFFSLAGSLHDFRSIKLESRRNVANMGEKTLTYANQGRIWTVKYNYTRNREAEKLSNLFEGIATVEEHISALLYKARFDPLGLPGELARVRIDLDNHNLTDPALMAPVLKQIESDPQYLHIAQIRARKLLARIESN